MSGTGNKFIIGTDSNPGSRGTFLDPISKDIGKGTSELNAGWIQKLKDAKDEEEENFDDPMTEMSPSESNSPPLESQKKTKVSKPSSAGSSKGKSKMGSTSLEKKAVAEYTMEDEKTEVQIAAFLDGYRMKQDYTLVSMRSQIEQLQKVVDVLTSAATSVTRASTDMIEATSSSSAKLAMSVTAFTECKKQSALEKEEGSETSSQKNSKYDLPAQRPSGPSKGSSISKIKASNVKESERIKEIEAQKAVIAPLIEEPKVDEIPLNLQEVETCVGLKIQEIKDFYEIGDIEIASLIDHFKGPLKYLLSTSGGNAALRGKMRKFLASKRA